MIVNEFSARALTQRPTDGVFARACEADENYESVIEGGFQSILVSTKGLTPELNLVRVLSTQHHGIMRP
ncbi:MAG: hypothetical protein QOH25_4036 [Acidobacteriota bacterium]|nr:hypothetical protein [Acidobacteriota bacterium]